MSEDIAVDDKIKRIRQLLMGDMLHSVNRDILELTDIVDHKVESYMLTENSDKSNTKVDYVDEVTTRVITKVHTWLEQNLHIIIKQTITDILNENKESHKR